MIGRRLGGHAPSIGSLAPRLALAACLIVSIAFASPGASGARLASGVSIALSSPGASGARLASGVRFVDHRAEHGSAPRATAARTIALNENGNLHLAKSNGVDKLYEQGQGTGTFNCLVQLTLTISSRQVSVAAAFTAYPAGGSISGHTIAHYRVAGTTSYFTGSLSITHGTGRYAHASATALQLSGKMNRTSYAATVHVTGRLHV